MAELETNITGLTAQAEQLLQQSRQSRAETNKAGEVYAKQAYDIACQAKNTQLKVKSLRELINYASYFNGNYAEAEHLAKELLKLTNPEINIEEEVVANNVLGICSDIKGDYSGSRGFYLKTIALFKEGYEYSTDALIGLGNAYYNLSKLYVQLDAAEERLGYMEKALEVFERVNDNDGIARVWNLRAAILPEDAPIAERLQLFETAYSYFKQGKDVSGAGSCLANIGLCYCRQGNFDKGLPILNEALEILNIRGNYPMIGFNLFQVGEAYRFKGEPQKAVEYLEKAEDVLLKANAKVHLNVVYKEWAANLAALGDYEGAYSKLNKYVDLLSDRLKFDRQSAVEEARLKIALKEKEIESAVLKRKNEEIEIYNEKLKQSNAELNQFAYVASHDLKEPLRMVSNYMQLLAKSFGSQLDDDQAVYMRYASDGAKRMYALIDSLLVFSRATMDTDLKQVDLNDVLDEVKRIVLSSVNREVNIESDELPVIKADYDQMVQLFQNLLGNSIKYNENMVVNVRVSYVLSDHEHRFIIDDNGIGIAPQHREIVFDIFRRLHPRENYSGTGIGLAICKKIVHRLNGRIWVDDSTLGGSAFVFTIPRKAPVD
jgi:signal transduction histidine kinase